MRSSATSAASGSRPASTVWLPTPPPDIDVELWRASIAAIGRALARSGFG